MDHFAVGREPQHVTPSHDLQTLWVVADKGNSFTRIDPRTGRHEPAIPIADPSNLYYTPGRYAIVVAERKKRQRGRYSLGHAGIMR